MNPPLIDPSVLAQFPGATPDEVAVYLQRADGRVRQAVALFEGDQSRRRPGRPAGSGFVSSSNPTAGKPNEYFVGSGQAVVGPRNPHLPDEQQRPSRGGEAGSHRDDVESVFERARAQGPIPDDERGSQDIAFTGAGRRLGHTEGPSPVIAPIRRRIVTIRIAFYENGFVVGEGPLRSLDDEKGKQFCIAINKGFIPRELVAEYGQDVDLNVNLEDHRQEKYVAPRQPISMFGGEGRTLQASQSAPAAAPRTNNNNNMSATAPPTMKELNNDIETCTVAVLNFMGKRFEFKFNPTVHTVLDLRVLAATTMGEPPLGPHEFQLAARDVPPRQITDNSLTIEAAKLKNGTVMMRKL